MLTKQDIAEYIDMKVAFNIGYEENDARVVFFHGDFQNYTDHFLHYMLTVIYNGARVGSPWAGNLGEVDKLRRKEMVNAKNKGFDLEARIKEFLGDYIPRLAKEIAMDTLGNHVKAINDSYLRRAYIFLVLETYIGVVESEDLKEKITEEFWDRYYQELEGKDLYMHMSTVTSIVDGWELHYSKSWEDGYVKQIERYKLTGKNKQ